MGHKDRDRDRDNDKEAKPARKRKKKPCLFCVEKMLPDYKKIDMMRRFISDRGKVQTPRSSGCCAKHQRAVAREIKKARQIGLISYTVD